MCCLGSASDWLNQISHAARPIRSTTQIWVVTRHQYGTSALVSHKGKETRGSVAKKKMPEAWKIRNWQKIKTESTRKLSNFNFQWIKPCTRIISITLYFLTLFEGYKCNKLYEITLKKKLSWKPEKLQKLQISQNEILRMTRFLPVFSQILWNLKFILSGLTVKL